VNPLKITLIIPTYNERENLPRIAAAVFAQPLPGLSLLVVDDNSPDGTGQIAEDLKQEYPGRVDVMHRPGKLGMGTAYIQGMQQLLKGSSDVIGHMDADFSHPPEKLPVLAEALSGAGVAIGSRYVPGGSTDREWPLWRKGLSAWGNFYARGILGLSIHDVTAGFKLWKRSTLAAMPLDRIRSNGYIFQVEMNYVATRLGFAFHEVPIYFAERKLGKSKMSLRIQMEAAVRVWQLRGMYRDLKPL
jgi:dolichol-phosphate mannosyltransferase